MPSKINTRWNTSVNRFTNDLRPSSACIPWNHGLLPEENPTFARGEAILEDVATTMYMKTYFKRHVELESIHMIAIN